MAIRFPYRTKSSTSTTSTGTYTLAETPAAGYRTLTQAVLDGDLANGDQICYIVVDTTVTDGPKLLETGVGTWDNTAKTLTRDTIFQPNGTAVSWGAGVRDCMIVDNPALYLLLAGGTMTGLLNILLSGSLITPAAATGLVVQRSSTAGAGSSLSVIAGSAGVAAVNLGNPADEDSGGVTYNNSTGVLWLRSGGTDRVQVDGTGVLRDASGAAYLTGSSFAAGTKMVFVQAAAPAGWTQVTAQNDRVLRVVSGTGAGVGGSWTISGISVQGHSLIVSELPVHNHNISYGLAQATSGGPGFVDVIGSGSQTGATDSAGGNGSHTHALTIGSAWRPAYQDVIVCSKD